MRSICKVTAVALVLFSSTVANAQIIGVKGGVSFSQFKDKSGTLDQHKLLGWGGGPTFEFGLGTVGLRAELLSVAKGYQYDNPTEEKDSKLKLNYLEVPITAIARMGPLFVFAGPGIALEGSCTSEVQNGQLRVAESCDNQGTTIFRRRKLDLLATVGGGVRRKFGRNTFMLEARNTWGFTNINKDDDVNTLHNRSFSIYAGVSAAVTKRPR